MIWHEAQRTLDGPHEDCALFRAGVWHPSKEWQIKILWT